MGKSLIIPGADFSANAIYPVLTQLTIDNGTELQENVYQYAVTPTPANADDSVSWAVVSGNEYATIDEDGVLTVLNGASSSTVVIRATSLSNPNVFADKTLIVTYGVTYIEFADNAVKNICMQWSTDGVGVTIADAANANVTQQFKGNTTIEEFTEFKYFTKNNELYYQGMRGCSGLTKIGIPENITSVREDYFQNCSALSQVHISDLDKYLKIVWSNATAFPFLTSGNGGLYVNGTLVTGALSYPSGATIAAGIAGCMDITSVSLPSSVTSVMASAFVHCEGMTAINLENVQTIGNTAFRYCNALTSVTMTAVTSIGNQVFMNCPALVNVEIGANCTSIGSQAFANAGAPGAKTTFIIRATTPPTLANANAFTTNNVKKIYVPYSADHSVLSTYQNASIWSGFTAYLAELDQDGNIPT